MDTALWARMKASDREHYKRFQRQLAEPHPADYVPPQRAAAPRQAVNGGVAALQQQVANMNAHQQQNLLKHNRQPPSQGAQPMADPNREVWDEMLESRHDSKKRRMADASPVSSGRPPGFLDRGRGQERWVKDLAKRGVPLQNIIELYANGGDIYGAQGIPVNEINRIRRQYENGRRSSNQVGRSHMDYGDHGYTNKSRGPR